MEEKIYYLDNANTSFLSSDVYKKILECYTKCQGDERSIYSYGESSRLELVQARQKVAKAIGANEDEIIFTSGLEESNNWAIKGLARANSIKGKHIITSVVEDSSILDACHELQEEGYKVTYVPVDEYGVVDYAEIIKSIGPDTCLISIGLANQEVGSLQPIRAISELANQNGVVFHTDASQAIGAMTILASDLGVHCMTISSQTVGGPKGVGAIYLKNGTKISKLIAGDNRNLRAGNLNIPLIAGFGLAIENATTDLEEKVKNVRVTRKYFQKRLSEVVHNIDLNGHPVQRLANNANIMFEGAESEAVVSLLSKEGVCAASCTGVEDGTNAPSRTLIAMGKKPEWARSSVRFTFGSNITKEDVDEIVEIIRKVVKKVRSISAIRIYKNKVEL